MPLHGPVTRLEPQVAHAVLALAERAGRRVGHTPLGDEPWEELTARGDGHFVAAWATDRDDATGNGGATGDHDATVTAYVQLVRPPAEPGWTAEVFADPDAALSLADVGAPLLRRCLDTVGEMGGGTVQLWAADATPAHAELAARAGLHPYRGLHQMQRPLPVGESYDLPLRPFVPGQDEDAVLEVNRLAFAKHPEQGRLTRAMLDERIAEPWFDAKGFLLSERDGRLAGFCWTKLFAEERPVLGEIYVICVHPDFGGHGLGRGLVLAGLDHLSGVGATVGMLFVEADNEAALDLYHRLGFEIVRTDRSFSTTVRPGQR
jgi:mycothiol synthase